MSEFSPNDDHTALLSTCVDGVLKLTNAMVLQLSPGARASLSTEIFVGARIAVEIELTPCPAVVCTVYSHGQEIELFRLIQPPKSQAETTH